MLRGSGFKLSIISAVFFILILTISPVNSFLWDENTNEGTNITMNGLKFNIPDGYAYDSDYTSKLYESREALEGTEMEYLNKNLKINSYSDDNGNFINIQTHDKGNLTIDNLIDRGYTPKEVNGKKGALDHSSEDGFFIFFYSDGDQFVTITVTEDVSILEKVIL